MNEIRVKNYSSAPETVALRATERVVSEGRVSSGGRCYCYATRLAVEGHLLMVFSKANKRSDSFEVWDASP